MQKMTVTLSTGTSARVAIDRPVAIAALVGALVIPDAIYLLLPAFVSALSNVHSLDEVQIGLLASADLAGIAVSTATGMWWVRRLSWPRVIRIALAVFLAANACCFGAVAFWPLLVLRFVAGLSGGAAYATALAAISDTRNASRNAALMVCTQIIFGAVGIYALPYVSAAWQLNALYGYIIVWLLPLLVLCWKWFPDDAGIRPRTAPAEMRTNALKGTVIVTATAVFALTVGAVWGYLERVAVDSGLEPRQASTAVSVGFLLSLTGSALAAWQGLRLGRIIPMAISGILQCAALVIIARLSDVSDPRIMFFIASAVFQIAWCYVVSYQIIVFNDVDPTGRFLPFYGTTYHGAMAAGPYVGALVVVGGRYSALLMYGGLTLAVSYALFLLSIVLNRRAVGARLEVREASPAESAGSL
jgi:MFS family permease